MKSIKLNKVTTILLVICTSILLLVSCSSSSSKFTITQHSNEQWADLVDKTIPDQQRATKVKQLGFQLIELADSATQNIEELSAKSVALNENYYATKADLQNVFDEFLKTRKLAFTKYRDIIFAMRSEVSDEEWNKLTN